MSANRLVVGIVNCSEGTALEEKREDRRASYSKKMIRESLYELMKTKPLNKITVKEICELADVNRSTFYAYYMDIYDLHQKIIKEFFSKQRDIINFAVELLSKREDVTNLSIDDFQEIMLFYLKTVKANKELYKFIFNQNSTNSIHLSFGKLFFNTILNESSIKIQEELKPIFRRSFTFISGGTTAILMDWLKSECSEDVTKLSRYIAYYYNGVFNGQKFARRG